MENNTILITESNEPLTIKVKYLNDKVTRLKKINVGDWIDLYAAEEVVLFKNDFKLVNLGVAMELPKGYEAILAPRSSTFKNWGCIQTNSIGVIDETYCGDEDWWKIPLYCLSVKTNWDCTIIRAGDKIAQFRIIKHMPNVNIEEVETLGNKSRGGFGTTGTK